jgi:hypothetical protein
MASRHGDKPRGLLPKIPLRAHEPEMQEFEVFHAARQNPGHRHDRQSDAKKMSQVQPRFQAILKELGNFVQFRFS